MLQINFFPWVRPTVLCAILEAGWRVALANYLGELKAQNRRHRPCDVSSGKDWDLSLAKFLADVRTSEMGTVAR